MVFLAEDRMDNSATRVVKQLIQRTSGDDFERQESVRLFMREAEILKKLDHYGIVKIHDSHASPDGRYYLVMDYVPGRNLEMIINTNGPLTNDLVVRIGIQCCDVLEYLHLQAEAIIYRDLKPSNLMLTPEGEVIFIDFGIARQFMPKEAATRVVTAGYSPPEQYFGRQDTRSDIYSLGATLSHLLTGVRPKPLTQGNPVAQNPSVLPSLNALIRRMTENEVENRPPSAAAVRYALYKIYNEIHPEWEMPEGEDPEMRDQREQLEQAKGLKNRMSGTDGYATAPGAQARPGSGEYRNHQREVEQRRLSGGHPLQRRAGENMRGPHVTEDEALSLIDKVKRWIDSTLRR